METSSKIALFFSTHFPFNKDGLEELLNSFETRSHPAGTFLLKPNRIEKELGFIESGMVREYYSTEGKETNTNFFEEGEFITDMISFYNSTATKKWQESLSHTQLKVLSKTTFDKLLDKYNCGRSIVEDSFQNIIKHKENKEYNRITKSPEDLYLDLLKSKPSWLKRIPQYHIASYLSITPETLSRIRKRIS